MTQKPTREQFLAEVEQITGPVELEILPYLYRSMELGNSVELVSLGVQNRRFTIQVEHRKDLEVAIKCLATLANLLFATSLLIISISILIYTL